ncbi:MerR family transcriptional regulator [Endozoicomonadaceae bacterium StTr2]
MKVSELCRQAQVSKALVRHYESLGLIYSRPVQAGSRQYRDFPDETVRRLQLIRQGQAIGFTLKDIAPLLDAFMAKEMSRGEALQVLLEQKRRIEDVIECALQTHRQISEKIDHLHQKPSGGCFSEDNKKG